MAIETEGNTTRLSGEDAAVFRYEMTFTDITAGLFRWAGIQVEPEIWADNDAILDRLRSMKRGRDWFEALISMPGFDEIVAKVRELKKP